VSEVSQRLAQDETLVMLLPGEAELYVWVVTAEELPAFKRVAIAASALRGLVARVRASLEFSGPRGRPPAFDQAAANELYRLMLAPVLGGLKGARHLIIAPAGPLAQLPFAALVTRKAEDARARDWLIQQYSITQVPSVGAWLTLRRLPPARQAPEPLIAWGDPQFGAKHAAVSGTVRRIELARAPRTQDSAQGSPAVVVRYDQIPPLPETREELLAIAAALKADPKTDLFLGLRATRDSVIEASRSGLLARKRVVVFATHGLMAGDLPGLDQPALVLSAEGKPATPLAPLLTLDDVLALRLNADWVVLSACNTAMADGRGEETFSGLARGFLYAGARRVLVTQWAVETISAKQLTSGLFEDRAAFPAAPAAESLRRAMLKVMAQPGFAHPVFWAPYLLLGDGGA
jgi:CHAT domain-containing protein